MPLPRLWPLGCYGYPVHPLWSAPIDRALADAAVGSSCLHSASVGALTVGGPRRGPQLCVWGRWRGPGAVCCCHCLTPSRVSAGMLATHCLHQALSRGYRCVLARYLGSSVRARAEQKETGCSFPPSLLKCQLPLPLWKRYTAPSSDNDVHLD